MNRLVVLLLALALDLTVGDPPNRFHPLMLMGRWLARGRRQAPRQHRFWYGAGWTTVGTFLFSLPWQVLETRKKQGRRSSSNIIRPWSIRLGPLFFLLHLVTAALGLKAVFAYRSLRLAVTEVEQALAANNLLQARRLLSWHLVSRDTSDLSAAEVAGAAIESLAENLTDSLIAPLLAYAGGGLPAAWAYRFVNTADAMWGYRMPEFEQLGKFPARLDDALNWLPARLTGWLLVLAAWLAREDARSAARTMLAQHDRPASPNAGWTMSAVAGALGVTLSKRNFYELVGGQAELTAGTIRRALRVADICVGLSVLLVGATVLTPKIGGKTQPNQEI